MTIHVVVTGPVLQNLPMVYHTLVIVEMVMQDYSVKQVILDLPVSISF